MSRVSERNEKHAIATKFNLAHLLVWRRGTSYTNYLLRVLRSICACTLKYLKVLHERTNVNLVYSTKVLYKYWHTSSAQLLVLRLYPVQVLDATLFAVRRYLLVLVGTGTKFSNRVLLAPSTGRYRCQYSIQ